MFNLGKDHTPPKVNINAMPKIILLKEDNVRQGYFSHEDYLRLLEALPSYMRGPVTFAYHTGWRKEEILDLTWDKVNLKEGTVTLPPGHTKERKMRHLYLEKSLLKMLKIQHLNRQGSDYVFHRKGHKIKDLRWVWNKACRELGLGYGYRTSKRYADKREKEGLKPGPYLHDLRRTAVRTMERAGVPRKLAMTRTGHKTESVYERYNIVAEDDLKEVAKTMEKYINGN